MLVLYAVFLAIPVWLVRLVLVTPKAEWPPKIPRELFGQWLLDRGLERCYDDRCRLFLRGRRNSGG